ncbi:P1 family peptidase [Thalassobacillus sp. CUG 92003]|uniref:P1 family peptidase n=1 Tax=Thalassobacillus sp. CUG 92003 TaxID=2736641 RepID=UPI0015E75077|nr:P1 family peptidase [Thalassobacillus sp. CUG 92003]
MQHITLNELHDFNVGHASNERAATGCSVVICAEGAVASVSVKGGAPGTRETDLLRSDNMVERVHAVLLAGGSAFGLDAAGGVMRYLEENGIGFEAQGVTVPIVPGAILFDLAIGQSDVRPDHNMGYQACIAQNLQATREGNIGAGTGATVGKAFGHEYAMKSGVGVYALQVGNLKIGAIVCVNSLGDIIDFQNGNIIAGAYDQDNQHYLDTEACLLRHGFPTEQGRENTTIGCIMSNADVTKSQAHRMAVSGHDGLARTMRPAHTMLDGDALFAMNSPKVEADPVLLDLLSAKVVEHAVLRAVQQSATAYGLPGLKSNNGS